MSLRQVFAHLTIGTALFALAACGNSGFGRGSLSSGNVFGGNQPADEAESEQIDSGQTASEEARERRISRTSRTQLDGRERLLQSNNSESIWDLFSNKDDPNTTLEVNKFIWVASLDVLDFLPIQAADPFSGVIVTGYGRPPGGRAAYRATVHVTDPALDARSLNLALERQGGGTVDADTVRAVEDAILTRARQLRIQHGNL